MNISLSVLIFQFNNIGVLGNELLRDLVQENVSATFLK